MEVRQSSGKPVEIRYRGCWRRVRQIQEVWRVDEAWWRSRPIRRTYFHLQLESGTLLTVYHDDQENAWWSQPYS